MSSNVFLKDIDLYNDNDNLTNFAQKYFTNLVVVLI